jgi:hypothetical protein
VQNHQLEESAATYQPLATYGDGVLGYGGGGIRFRERGVGEVVVGLEAPSVSVRKDYWRLIVEGKLEAIEVAAIFVEETETMWELPGHIAAISGEEEDAPLFEYRRGSALPDLGGIGLGEDLLFSAVLVRCQDVRSLFVAGFIELAAQRLLL